ncbi:unnamed protein product [Linum trigynum]
MVVKKKAWKPSNKVEANDKRSGSEQGRRRNFINRFDVLHAESEGENPKPSQHGPDTQQTQQKGTTRESNKNNGAEEGGYVQAKKGNNTKKPQKPQAPKTTNEGSGTKKSQTTPNNQKPVKEAAPGGTAKVLFRAVNNNNNKAPVAGNASPTQPGKSTVEGVQTADRTLDGHQQTQFGQDKDREGAGSPSPLGK